MSLSESAPARAAAKDSMFSKPIYGRRLANDSELEWKTSDWIIQEIGLAIGRGMHCCLLVERGVRPPGGLQGNLEYITLIELLLRRYSPESLKCCRCCKNLNRSPQCRTHPSPHPSRPKTVQKQEKGGLLSEPDQSWDEAKYRTQYSFGILLKDHSHQQKVLDAFIKSPFAQKADSSAAWAVFCELQKIRWGMELASKN